LKSLDRGVKRLLIVARGSSEWFCYEWICKRPWLGPWDHERIVINEKRFHRAMPGEPSSASLSSSGSMVLVQWTRRSIEG